MGNTGEILGNRALNTVAIAPRMAGTVVTTVADLATTLDTARKEAYEISADTSQRIKQVLLGAWNHGKFHHKVANVALSPIIATGTAIEGAVRSVVQPVVNGVVNTFNTGKNAIKNARRSTFGRVFSKKPISDFSYDHIKTRGLKLNNRISKWQFGKGKSTSNTHKTVTVPTANSKLEKTPEKPQATPSTTNTKPKESTGLKGQNKSTKGETESESETAPVAQTNTETNNTPGVTSIDQDKFKNAKSLTELAGVLGVEDNEKMSKHKLEILNNIKEGKDIKESLTKYEDEARKIVGEHKGDKFSHGNIAIDLLKTDVIKTGLKSTKGDKKYQANLKKYLYETIDTAKKHIRNIGIENGEKAIDMLTKK